MNVQFTNQFNREISKLRDKKLAIRIDEIILEVKNAKQLSEIDNLKKLKGFKKAYRIRLGDYRIGVVLESNTVVFAAFNNRKDIYKYFP